MTASTVTAFHAPLPKRYDGQKRVSISDYSILGENVAHDRIQINLPIMSLAALAMPCG